MISVYAYIAYNRLAVDFVLRLFHSCSQQHLSANLRDGSTMSTVPDVSLHIALGFRALQRLSCFRVRRDGLQRGTYLLWQVRTGLLSKKHQTWCGFADGENKNKDAMLPKMKHGTPAGLEIRTTPPPRYSITSLLSP